MRRIERIKRILIFLDFSFTVIEEGQYERYRACNLIEHGDTTEDGPLCTSVAGLA